MAPSMQSQIEALLPHAMVATRKWLLAQGVGIHTFDNAVKSDKLRALAVGVYARTGVPVPWEGLVASLQRMSASPVHVGGKSALELFGLGHYVSRAREKTVHLYSEDKLPTWLGKLETSYRFKWHGTKTLWSPELLFEKAFVREHEWREELPPILVSCPEKAVIELLVDVPDTISFEHADELMQGLTSLSPRKLEQLLKVCRHVKAKRLFFWLAERQNYPWIKKLNYQDFDLGSGKRVVEKGGKLNQKYLITVPEHMNGQE